MLLDEKLLTKVEVYFDSSLREAWAKSGRNPKALNHRTTEGQLISLARTNDLLVYRQRYSHSVEGEQILIFIYGLFPLNFKRKVGNWSILN